MQEQSLVPRKRIHNPRTGKYYALRVRSSSKGRRGTIKGLWKPPKKGARTQHPSDPSFYFYRDYDEPLGVSVQSLNEFKERIPHLDARSLEFHFLRGDFEAFQDDYDTLGGHIGHAARKYEEASAKLTRLGDKLQLAGETHVEELPEAGGEKREEDK